MSSTQNLIVAIDIKEKVPSIFKVSTYLQFFNTSMSDKSGNGTFFPPIMSYSTEMLVKFMKFLEFLYYVTTLSPSV